MDENYLKAYDNLGLTLDALGQTEEAIKVFQKGIEKGEQAQQKSKWPYFNLGELLLRSNRIAESIRLFQSALAIDPKWSKGYFHLGKAYAQQQDLESALKAFETAKQLSPRSPDVYYQLAQIYRRQGRLKQSGEALREFDSLKRSSVSAPTSEE